MGSRSRAGEAMFTTEHLIAPRSGGSWLSLLADEPFALVFDANGVMLRVAKVQALDPARHTVLGWRVSDIRATVEVLTNKGVLFERYTRLAQDETGIWTSPSGARVTWFKDADGNVLSLTQF
jgi:hypothetical protein